MQYYKWNKKKKKCHRFLFGILERKYLEMNIMLVIQKYKTVYSYYQKYDILLKRIAQFNNKREM